MAKLITEYPLTAKDSEGRNIWKGYYRFPTELPINLDDEYTRVFILAGAKIFARMLQVKVTDVDVIKITESMPQSIDFKSNNTSFGDSNLIKAHNSKEEDLKNLLNILKSILKT